MKNIDCKDIPLKDKRVLIRLDLNVPLKNNKITDANRIDKIIPTLNFLIEKQAKIIIISHIGRPKGKYVKDLSLNPVCKDLEKKLNQKIKLITKDINKIKSDELFINPDERIIMLENLRFYEDEESNNEKFAKHLASFADIYVNDAFSCSHRKHASVFQITKYINAYAGLQLKAEKNALDKIIKNIEKPITCIIGGSKISSKINVIKNLITKFDNLIIVGGMANNILKYKKYPIGKSVNEKNCDHIIEEIFNLSNKEKCKILFPIDVATGLSFNGSSIIKNLDQVDDNDIILDIGPKTIKLIEKVIDESKTILWNGPVGYFENKNFKNGSFKLAKKIADKTKENKIYAVAGGGDTVALLNDLKLIKNFNFVSTAGGAFLEFLEGKDLPGIKALG